jgi:CheY-like chemotaxis protein
LIALTGYGQPQDQARSQEAGFSFHLVKPVRAETLMQILTRPSIGDGDLNR